MSYTYPARPRFSFAAKVALTLAGVVAGDGLFWDQPWGSTQGAAALALAISALALHREIRRDRAALIAAAAAGAFALVLIDRPGVLAWLMFWTALSLAVLLPRARFDDAWRWFQRLVFHGVVATVGPLIDALRLRKLHRKARRPRFAEAVGGVALPLIGGAIFLGLFSMANPVISDALENLRLPFPSLFRLIFWGLVVVILWGVFRPHGLRRPLRLGPSSALVLPGVTVASVTLSLLVFNALFALQNGLDIAFLWSGARLPQGLTLAEYAHRGAYPLIVTALLAGLFVLVALRPGSPTGENRTIRRLVTFWVVQNVFLVASSVLRTLDYIDAYSLTRLRIAALAWMGLVALGLVLIIWRLLRGKSAAWLINANALAAAIVLTASSAVDFGALAAAWNVRHAREVGGHGVELDLCYLNQLGPAALVPLTELQGRPLPPAFVDRVDAVRRDVMVETFRSQQNWHGWTWRNQRRLGRAHALIYEPYMVEPSGRRCDGSVEPPPKPESPQAPATPTIAPAPLTSSAPS